MKNSKILIIDDNPKNIQVLANTLTDLYEIEYTTDGYDAISWIKQEPFDLILLDVMMPNINGFQVCEKIRNDIQFKDIPIIFLTAKTDIDSIVEGFRIGGQDYITKPFNVEELKARINTHLELKKSKEKLSDLNKWLEKEVELKTKKLNTAYKELELLDIAKDEFINLVSHELRTPLNGIIGFTSILKNSIDSDKLLNYISLMETSSNRMLKFAQQATLITSLRSKSYSFTPSILDISNVINYTELHFKKLLDEKAIRLNVNYKAKQFEIMGESHLLEEAFKSIIENAIYYSPVNSIINITTSDKDDSFSLCIKDQGKGFSELALQNIFKPFGYGQKHIDKNIGLGLHLVKLIMDLHQIKISVSNSEQGGAIVLLDFPKIK